MPGPRQLSIITACGSHADAFQTVLRQWSTTGLLGPIAYVTGPIDESSRIDNLAVELLSFGDAGAEPRPGILGDALAMQFDVVRFVIVQPIDGGEAPPIHGIAEVLDRLRQRHVNGNTPTVMLNLLVPSSAAEGTSPLTLETHTVASWTNVLVAPEGRVAPGSNHLGLADGRLAGHAALATATAAAIWSGVDTGPFDVATPVTGQVSMRLMRTFAGVVDGDPVVDFLSDNVLLLSRIGHGDAWPEPAVPGVLERLPQVPRDQIPRRMSDLADHAMTVANHSMRFRDIAPLGLPPRATLSFREAFRTYIDFLFGRAMRLPSEYGAGLAADTRRRLENVVNSRLFGADSAVEVTFGGRPRRGDPPPFSLDTREDVLQQVQEVLGDSPNPPFNAVIWSELRDVCFGVIDGSSLPGTWPWNDIGGVLPVATNPGDIVPPPNSRLTVGVGQLRSLGLGADEPLTLGACDALTAYSLLKLVRQAPTTPSHDAPHAAPYGYDPSLAQPAAPGDVPLQWIDDGESAGIPFDLDTMAPVVPAPTPDGMFAAGPPGSPDAAPAYETVGVDAPFALDIDSYDDSVEGLEQSLISWASERSDSFLYGVANRCGIEIAKAEKAMFDALADLQSPPEEPRGLRRDSGGRWLLIAGIVGLVLMIVAGRKEWWGLGLVTGIVIGVVWLIITIAGGLYRAYRRLNAHFQELHRRPPPQTAAQWSLERLRNAVNELARLQLQYRVLMEWCSIVGHLVHEPFVKPEGPAVEDPFRRLDSAPDSLTLLRAGRTDGQALQLTTRMRNVVFQQHWMRSLYHEVEALMLQAYHGYAGLAPDVRPTGPAEDTGIRTLSSRKYLIDLLEDGRVGRWAWEQMVQTITTRTGELPLGNLFDSFQHEGTPAGAAYWGEHIASIEQFLGAFQPVAATVDANSALDVSLIAPGSRVLVNSLVENVYLALPSQVHIHSAVQPDHLFFYPAPAHLAANGDFWTLGLRADLSAPFAASACSLFHNDADGRVRHGQAQTQAEPDGELM